MPLALLLLLFTGVTAFAQSSLHVTAERPSRLIAADGYTTFQIDALNTSQSPIELQIIRIANELPGDGWLSSVCSPHRCYDAEVDTLDPYPIEPGGLGGAQVHVYTGDAGSGRVVLLLDPRDGTEPVRVELTTTVGEVPAPPLFIREDSVEAHIMGGDTAVFQIAVLNTTDDTLDVSVERLETDFPDDTWGSVLCHFSDCLPPESDIVPTVQLGKGRAVLYYLKVAAGNVLGAAGQVELKIDAGDGSEPSYRRYTVSVAQVTGVKSERIVRSTMSARPDPARTDLRLVLPASMSGKSIPLYLYDLRGARIDLPSTIAGPVDDGNSLLHIDVSALVPGLWFWQAEVDGVICSGSFHVQR